MEEFIKKFVFYKLVNKVPTPCPMMDIVFQKPEDNIVKKSQINEDIEVSTVFLNHNMNMFRGAPVFFETIVFGGELDQRRIRSSTWEEAEAAHEQMCHLVINTF